MSDNDSEELRRGIAYKIEICGKHPCRHLGNGWFYAISEYGGENPPVVFNASQIMWARPAWGSESCYTVYIGMKGETYATFCIIADFQQFVEQITRYAKEPQE